ncbi:MFS transporter [Pseudolysinimonas sp.]|uniref:MFS transporter n=1 Tax=Pseudolysinimonas sp. TaxID=2680009 RepID=UPI003F7D10E5
MSAVPYLAASTPLRLASAGSSAAIPVLALQEVHSVAVGGGLVAASLAPSILAAPIAGALLDRSRHPTRLMVLSGVVTALAFALTALLGVVPTPLVAVGLVVAGAVTPFFMGGMSSFVTDAVPGSPERAFGADALSYNIGSVAGPALVAAVLVVPDAGRVALVVLAGAAVVGTVACALLRLPAHPTNPDRAGVVREIVQGSRFLATHRPIAVVTASGALSQVGQGALPIAAIGIALAATHHVGDAAWIVTGFAVGALVGSLAVTAWPIRRIPAPVVMGAAFAATGALALAAAAGAPFPVVIGLVGLSGVATGPGVAAMLLLRTRNSPRALRSQVFTVAAGLRATGAAVGAGLAGLLPAGHAGLLLALIGACWIVSAGIMAAYPRRAIPVA